MYGASISATKTTQKINDISPQTEMQSLEG